MELPFDILKLISEETFEGNKRRGTKKLNK